jgi:hypothetical protein
MKPFGTQSSFAQVRQEVQSVAAKLRIHPHEEFLEAAVHAIIAGRSGFRVMLEGPSGLTTLAKFVGFCYFDQNADKSSFPEIPRVLLGEDISKPE